MPRPSLTNSRSKSLVGQPGNTSEMARERMQAAGGIRLRCDWLRAVFIHYQTDPQVLQHQIPFELDLHEGRAYVSVVAFHLERMRPDFGGWLAAALMKPVATHELLNIRTYVRHRGEPGIYFMREFLPNRLSLRLGPLLCGLPYHWAQLTYNHCHEKGRIEGHASDGQHQFTYGGGFEHGLQSCGVDTLEEFLLERYVAFTSRNGINRFFRVWHPPWPQTRINIEIGKDRLLATTGRWYRHARYAGANYSPGFENVCMQWPRKLK